MKTYKFKPGQRVKVIKGKRSRSKYGNDAKEGKIEKIMEFSPVPYLVGFVDGKYGFIDQEAYREDELELLGNGVERMLGCLE
jgi:hypothetical protein